MRHGSLFSGIGGFDLAARWMGWENVFQVEWDKYCQKVLEKNFPNVKRYGDIKEFDGTEYRGLIDVVSGGFPCQPFSHAGKRKGTSDDRYLWPEMLRVIREIEPATIVGENVAGLVSMENGKTLDRILSDLANEGYTTEQFIIPACGVGAWHRRDRIWIVAHNESSRIGHKVREYDRQRRKPSEGLQSEMVQQRRETQNNPIKRGNKDVSDTKSKGLEGFNEYNSAQHRNDKRIQFGSKGGRTENQNISTHTISQRRCSRDTKGQYAKDVRELRRSTQHGYWNIEPSVGRVANGIPNRVDRLKGLGNAIVPQVAYEIFKAIEQMNEDC